MNKVIIENYIKQIKKEDILKFGLQNNIRLSDEDVDILYHYLNEFWEEILYGNSEDVFDDMRKHFDDDKFFKMKNLFEQYFNRYRYFLWFLLGFD